MMPARKRFGQHFLEPAWAARVLAAIEPGPDDHIIEIGPGRGALTIPLAERVARVTAVELDRDMVTWLTPRVPKNVRVVSGDFLALPADAYLDVSAGAPTYRVAGNLPYNVSSPIIFRLLDLWRTTGRLQDATIMVQRELAERMAAPPGSRDTGVLSNSVQLDAEAQIRLTLPPGAFRPAPKVWSSVVRLTFRPTPVPLPPERRPLFDRILRVIFAQRRKTLSNALKPLATTLGVDARQAIQESGLDGTLRPENLHLADLAKLADTLDRLRTPSVV